MAIFEKVFGDNFLAKVAQIFHNLNNITDVATLKGTFEVFLATLEFLTTGRAGRDKRTNKKAIMKQRERREREIDSRMAEKILSQFHQNLSTLLTPRNATFDATAKTPPTTTLTAK